MESTDRKHLETNMDDVSRQRLDSVLAVVHLDLNSHIKSKIFPEAQEKSSKANASNSSSSTTSEQSCSFHPLKTCIDFGYYSFILPFRFVKDEQCQFQIKTSTTRKCIAFFVFLSSLIYYLTSARKRLSSTQKSAVITYFYVVHNLFHFVMLICYYDAVFRKPHGFLNLIRTLGNSTLIACHSKKMRVASILFQIIYLIGSILLQLIDIPIDAGWKPATIMNFFIHLARYTFLNDNKTPPDIAFIAKRKNVTDPNWSVMDYSLGILEILMLLAYSSVTSFLTTSYLYAPMSLWVSVKRFVRDIVPRCDEEDDDNDVSENTFRILQVSKDNTFARITGNRIMQKFNELQKLSSHINYVWGAFYFVAILDYIVWLATDLDVGIKAKEWLSRISSIWHFVTIMLLLFFSAECSRMMSAFRTWLIQYGKHIFLDENELSDLITLVETRSVGIGIDGLYIIDYPFTGQVATIIITFFIITLQYERNVDKLAK